LTLARIALRNFVSQKPSTICTTRAELRNSRLSRAILILESEINSGARHLEIVVSTINNVPAEITDPAHVRREANFQAGWYERAVATLTGFEPTFEIS
jgi:hypothetical protein